MKYEYNPEPVDPKLHDIRYGIIAYTLIDKDSPKIEILHFVGYWEKPTKHDWKHCEEELNTDPEFDLVGRINKDVFLMEATEDILEHYRNL